MDRRDNTLLYGQTRHPVDHVLMRLMEVVDVLEISDIDGQFTVRLWILGTRFEYTGATPRQAVLGALSQAEGSLRVNQSLVTGAIKWIGIDEAHAAP